MAVDIQKIEKPGIALGFFCWHQWGLSLLI